MIDLARAIGTVLIGTLAATMVNAQDGMPRRKPGLWEMAMEVPGRAGAAMKSQHCVDARSEEQARQRALDDAPNARCEQRNLKRHANGVEFEYSCTSSRGKTEGRTKLTGDMNASYTMENQVRFDPPRGGMSEGKMTLRGQWVGACPADMKPGEMRMAGLPMGGASAAGRGGRERPPPSAEQMQKIQEMVEQMKQQRGGKP